MKVDIEYIEWLQEERARINRAELADIEFYENRVRIDIPKKTIVDFSFIGLNNIDFITTGFYKDELLTVEE